MTGGGMETDEDLLAAMALGDEPAAKRFIDRHLTFVLRICQQRLRDRAKAEEVTQEVFLSVWRKAGDWQAGKAKVTTWLYRIAVNKSIDSLRQLRPSEDIDNFHFLSDDSDLADITLSHADDTRLIAEALSRLSVQQRQAVDLFYFQGCNQSHAADEMGITLAAFESILRRARQALHTELARHRSSLTLI